jgi:hypothetical protein
MNEVGGGGESYLAKLMNADFNSTEEYLQLEQSGRIENIDLPNRGDTRQLWLVHPNFTYKCKFYMYILEDKPLGMPMINFYIQKKGRDFRYDDKIGRFVGQGAPNFRTWFNLFDENPNKTVYQLKATIDPERVEVVRQETERAAAQAAERAAAQAAESAEAERAEAERAAAERAAAERAAAQAAERTAAESAEAERAAAERTAEQARWAAERERYSKYPKARDMLNGGKKTTKKRQCVKGKRSVKRMKRKRSMKSKKR